MSFYLELKDGTTVDIAKATVDQRIQWLNESATKEQRDIRKSILHAHSYGCGQSKLNQLLILKQSMEGVNKPKKKKWITWALTKEAGWIRFGSLLFVYKHKTSKPLFTERYGYIKYRKICFNYRIRIERTHSS